MPYSPDSYAQLMLKERLFGERSTASVEILHVEFIRRFVTLSPFVEKNISYLPSEWLSVEVAENFGAVGDLSQICIDSLGDMLCSCTTLVDIVGL
jgi:hypothetical protein